VSESLETADVRNLAMTKQVAAIALQAGTIKDKLTTANAAVLALRSDNSQSSVATESLRTEFKSQLVNLNGKYDALVIENSDLNKQLQSKDIELIRLQAYKEAVSHVESKHAAEKERVLQAQAKREAEQKALALKEQAKKEALALENKAKKAAEQQALALQEQAKQEAEKQALAVQVQTAEPLKVTEAKLDVVDAAAVEIKEAVSEIEAVEDVVEMPVTVKDN